MSNNKINPNDIVWDDAPRESEIVWDSDVKKKKSVSGYLKTTKEVIQSNIRKIGAGYGALSTQRKLEEYQHQDLDSPFWNKYGKFRAEEVRLDKVSRKKKGQKDKSFFDYMLPFGEFEDVTRKKYVDYMKQEIAIQKAIQKEEIKNVQGEIKQQEKVLKDYSGVEQFGINIVAGAAQQGVGLLASAATANPVPALLNGYLTTYGDRYGVVLANGGNTKQAANAAQFDSVVDVLANVAPVGNLVKSGGKEILKEFGKQASLDALYGFGSGASKSLFGKLYLDEDRNVLVDGLTEAGANVLASSSLKGIHAIKTWKNLKNSTKPVKDTPDINNYVQDNFGDDVPSAMPRELHPEEIGALIKYGEEIPNFDNPDSIRDQGNPLFQEENYLTGSYEFDPDLNIIRDRMILEDQVNVLKLLEDNEGQVIGEVIPDSNVKLKTDLEGKISETVSNSLVKEYGVTKVQEWIDSGFDPTYRPEAVSETDMGQLITAMRDAYQVGDMETHGKLLTAIKELGSESGKNLAALSHMIPKRFTDPAFLKSDVEAELNEVNNETESKWSKRKKLDANKEAETYKKAVKESVDEVSNEFLTIIDTISTGKESTGEYTTVSAKTIEREIRKRITGFRPKTLTKPQKLHLRKVIETYYRSGRTNLNEAVNAVLEALDNPNLTPEQRNDITAYIQQYLEDGFLYQKEKIKSSLNIKVKEEVRAQAALRKLEKMINSATVLDEKDFIKMLEQRLPRNVSTVLKANKINLKDFLYASPERMGELNNLLKDAFGDLEQNIKPNISNEVFIRIQDTINKTIKDFEVSKREAILKRQKSNTSAFVKSLDKMLDSGMLSESELQAFTDQRNGKITLTEKDKTVLDILQRTASRYEEGSVERSTAMYKIKKFLDAKKYAAQTGSFTKVMNALASSATVNALSSPITLTKIIFGNTVRGVHETFFHTVAGSLAAIQGNKGLSKAHFQYTKSYFNALKKTQGLIVNKDIMRALNNTSEKEYSNNILGCLKFLADNKEQYIELAWHVTGNNPNEILNSHVNQLSSEVFNPLRHIELLGKFWDNVVTVYKLPSDMVTLGDAVFKQPALEARTDFEIYKRIDELGITDQDQIEAYASNLRKKVEDYRKGSQVSDSELGLIEAIAEESHDEANVMTFSNEPTDPLGKTFTKAFRNPTMRILFNLFTRGVYNPVKYAVDTTTIHPITALYNGFFGRMKNDPAASIENTSKIITAGIFNAGLLMLLQNCKIIGQERIQDKGKADEGLPNPYSIIFPDGSRVNMSFVEPWGKHLLLMQDIINVPVDLMSNEEKMTLTKFGNFSMIFLQDSVAGDLTKGFNDLFSLFEGFTSPKEPNEERSPLIDYAGEKSKMFLPWKSMAGFFSLISEENKKTIVNNTDAAVLDKVYDEVIKTYAPYRAKDKLSQFSGKPIVNDSSVLGIVVGEEETEHEVLKWIARSNYPLKKIPKNVLGMDLTNEEYYDLLKYMGEHFDILETMDKNVSNPNFEAMNKYGQKKAFDAYMNGYYTKVAASWATATNNTHRIKELLVQKKTDDSPGVTGKGKLLEF